MSRISVIVPVYKVEAYLGRCVDSILRQTFQDIEVILVDDGSPDRCGALCEEYAARDSRVYVIHQENGGLSAARNAGTDWVFSHSDSQWITYVDSDDWIHPQTLELLLNAAQSQDVKISICGYGETTGEPPVIPPSLLLTERWSARKFYTQHFINATVAWGKLYHKSCLEGVRYPVGKIHEDEFVTYRLLFEQETLAVIPAPLYAYFQNPASITKQAWSPKRLHAWDAYDQQIAYFEARNDEEMVQYRYKGYLENIRTNLEAVQTASNAEEIKPAVRNMKKRIRSVVNKAWKLGYIHFWEDFDLLYGLFPLRAKLYRLKLEIVHWLRWKIHA